MSMYRKYAEISKIREKHALLNFVFALLCNGINTQTHTVCHNASRERQIVFVPERAVSKFDTVFCRYENSSRAY